jgi:beta-N-acetylhexosaminidase
VGLNKARLVDINGVNQVVAKPQSLRAAQRIADRAVTLVRDNKQVLPLQPDPWGTHQPSPTYQTAGDARGRLLLLMFSDDSRSDAGRLFDEELRSRIPSARVMYIDPRTADGLKSTVMSAVEAVQKIIVAIYEVPVSGKVVPGAPTNSNSVAVQSAPAALLQSVLQAASTKTAVVAMGTPYIASQFPEIQTYLCTFSNMKVSEVSAVKAIFGEIPMTGRLPVTIPNVAARGAGIKAPAQRSTGGSE